MRLSVLQASRHVAGGDEVFSRVQFDTVKGFGRSTDTSDAVSPEDL